MVYVTASMAMKMNKAGESYVDSPAFTWYRV